jgi:hypothetical protein
MFLYYVVLAMLEVFLSFMVYATRSKPSTVFLVLFACVAIVSVTDGSLTQHGAHLLAIP